MNTRTLTATLAACTTLVGVGCLTPPPTRAQLLAPISAPGTKGVVRLGANGDRGRGYTFTATNAYGLYGASSNTVSVNVDGYISVAGGYVFALYQRMTQTVDGVTPQGYISYQEVSQGVLVNYVSMPYVTYANNFPLNSPPSNTFQVMLYKGGGIGVGYGSMDSNSYAMDYWPSVTYGLSNSPQTKFSSLGGGCTSGLDRVQYPGLLGNQQYFLKDTNGDGCYDHVTQAVAAAPEPKPLLVLGFGICGLAVLAVKAGKRAGGTRAGFPGRRRPSAR